ncbi:S8 family serine peptidase [Ferrimonas balearica]|uniref:S8 family serine peptidase n=1 Tax=Ferrimonas balearica TaxID=44012 RepID=UPI001C993AA1|nr:S8 family serine peptidase [Ferrimonas balearica]MBY5991375.1 S8 family serine peptidase [Ferrimonas balearica]
MKGFLITSALLGTSFTLSAAELVVQWHNPAHAHNPDTLAQIASQSRIDLTLVKALQNRFDLIDAQGSDPQAIIDALKDTGYFSHVEPEHFIELPKTPWLPEVPEASVSGGPDMGTLSLDNGRFNDPFYRLQQSQDEQGAPYWGLSNVEAARQYAVDNVAIDRKVRIAVLDTGRWDHEDMTWSEDQANFVSHGYRCLTPDETHSALDAECREVEFGSYHNDAIDKSWVYESGIGAYQIKIDGHGLAVASQITATANNGIGIAGSAPSEYVEIVPVRVLAHNGGYNFDIANGIWWAIGEWDNGDMLPGEMGYVEPISEPVDIINLSLGGPTFNSCEASTYFNSAIERAREKGISVVIAAGNDQIDAQGYTPSNCGDALTVASNSVFGELSSFSNFGDAVDLSMLGERVYSGYITTRIYTDDECLWHGEGRNGCYAPRSGTSMAAPNVASVLALLKMVHPDKASSELEAMLLNTANPFTTRADGTPSRASRAGVGAGVVDALAALQYEDAHQVVQQSIRHRYLGYASTEQVQFLRGLEQFFPSACSLYDVKFGRLQQAAPGIRYHIYQVAGDGAVGPETSQHTTTLSVPLATVDRGAFPRVGVQSCRNDVCGEVLELDFSDVAAPEACGSES